MEGQTDVSTPSAQHHLDSVKRHPVVLDIGEKWTKVGFACSPFPLHIFPTMFRFRGKEVRVAEGVAGVMCAVYVDAVPLMCARG